MTEEQDNAELREAILEASKEAQAIVATVVRLEHDLAHATSKRGLIDEITKRVKEIVQ